VWKYELEIREQDISHARISSWCPINDEKALKAARGFYTLDVLPVSQSTAPKHLVQT